MVVGDLPRQDQQQLCPCNVGAHPHRNCLHFVYFPNPLRAGPALTHHKRLKQSWRPHLAQPILFDVLRFTLFWKPGYDGPVPAECLLPKCWITETSIAIYAPGGKASLSHRVTWKRCLLWLSLVICVHHPATAGQACLLQFFLWLSSPLLHAWVIESQLILASPGRGLSMDEVLPSLLQVLYHAKCQAIKHEDISQYILTPSSQDSASAQKTTAMLQLPPLLPLRFSKGKRLLHLWWTSSKVPEMEILLLPHSGGCMGQTAWI